MSIRTLFYSSSRRLLRSLRRPSQSIAAVLRYPPQQSLQTLSPTPPAPAPPHPSFPTILSASTCAETLAAFQSLQESPSLLLAVATRLQSLEPPDLQTALDFAIRSFKSLNQSHGPRSLEVAQTLRTLALISFRMGNFGDSLRSLETAQQILDFVKEESGITAKFTAILVDVQVQLARTKNAMGRRKEAVLELRRSVELREEVSGDESEVLGEAYFELAEAYVGVLDFAEALAFCRKALGLYEDEFGKSSMEVVKVRRLLGVVYTGLGENEEALEQLELAWRELGSLGVETELIQVEIDAANMQILLGRLDEAKSIVTGAVQRTEKESEARAYGLVTMAKIFCGEDKFDDARRLLDIACEIIKNADSKSSSKVVEMYAEMSMLYEMMNDFEIALSLMTKTLEMLKNRPEEQHLEGSMEARVGWLLLLTERASQAIPYLEGAIEKLKRCFGPNHFGLGFAYKHLGQAYLDTDQPQLAVKMFFLAKEIIDDSFGLYHEDSIDINQSIANVYGVLGRYDYAIKFQQLVLEAWEHHGPQADSELQEAHRLLWQLKRKAEGSRSAVFPANSLPATVQQ